MSRALHFLALLLLAASTLAADPPADKLPEKLPLEDVPLGLGTRTIPADNPLTAARVALGRRLFFDPILSADRSLSCASCHHPDRGFAGDRPRGVGGRQLPRRAPTLLNRAYGTAFFWDGRASSLEEQALQPIADPDEMGLPLAEAVKRLNADKDYRARFAAAFDNGVTAANVGKALAGFERMLLRGDSRVDRFRKNGEHDALTPQERHGLWLYESKARCWRCHGGANFSDEGFHNTGVGWGREPADAGRHAATRDDADRGKFKTPTLRGVSLTAPYMHDGSLKTLDDVVDFYDRGGIANPRLDPLLGPLHLSADERRALAAFLKAL
jgi:cytochrome c peroxidase